MQKGTTSISQKKIQIVTLGCAKNVVDSEKLLRQIKSGNYKIIIDDDKIHTAEFVIINTCGFINDAKQESIDTILSFVEAKKIKKIKKIIVMGCLSQRYKNELQQQIPEVDYFFGVSDWEAILKVLDTTLHHELLNERVLTTPKHYAYLKIAEGCDRTCSFCVIPQIRGKHISQPIEKLVDEANILAESGVRELLLISQDLTYYGLDLYKKQELLTLIKELEKIKKIEWIRLHYAYPSSFPLEVTEYMAVSEKLCHYLDIPFQHINDAILKSMKRNHTTKQTMDLIQYFRKKIPDIAIRTSLIVGYPGETDKEFNELLEFIKTCKFERLGIFAYSDEENTAAFDMHPKNNPEIIQERMDLINAIQADISLQHNENKINQTLKVLIDRIEGDFYIGRSQYDSPEIDNEVLIPKTHSPLTIGNFYKVKINDAEHFDLFGKIIH